MKRFPFTTLSVTLAVDAELVGISVFVGVGISTVAVVVAVAVTESTPAVDSISRAVGNAGGASNFTCAHD
jgi:hypothetical protein